MDYLSEAAKFTCNQGGIITCEDSGNKNVTHNGKILLTTGATVKTKNGICAVLTAMAQGTPQQCKCNLTTWTPFDPLKKSCGKPLLTEMSKNICTFGGVIGVMNSGVFGKIATELKPPPMTLPVAAVVNALADKKISAVEKIPETSAAAEKVSDTSVAEKKSPPQEELTLRCAACKKICPCRIRGTFAEHFKIPATNSAAELEKNYFAYLEKLTGLEGIRTTLGNKTCDDINFYRRLLNAAQSKADDADIAYLQSLIRRCELTIATGKIPWGYAAHHIIPGNEVFRKFPKIFRTANLLTNPANPKSFVFNINDAANCIKLLMNNQSARLDTIFDTARKKFSRLYKRLPKSISPTLFDTQMYELMFEIEEQLELKIQWHVGAHRYTFSKENFRELNDAIQQRMPAKNLIDYETALNCRMEQIENSVISEDVCPAAIRNRLSALIEDVRRHLTVFAQNPCASYPFFVSKNSFFYALLSSQSEDF